MAKGYFITLEGIDGCGKSTQAKLLYQHLQTKGCRVLLTREPGGTDLAEEIRRVILTPGKEELDPMAEILLYAASRAQHVNYLIKPALEAGQVVVSERFVHSSLAYQGYGLGWDLKLIRDINSLATGDIQPDLIFLLDSTPETSGKRVAKRSKINGHNTDRIEMRGLSFQDRVRTGFLKLAQEDPSIILINTAGKSINAVFLEITGILSEKLNI
ncbi:MAG: dTMP kinase [Firmicutes bacterium]|nr:dTMP kinase [Bacillota bacterium]